MASDSKIQWTHHTMNFWRGCRKVHAGCEACYAEQNIGCKLHGVKWGSVEQGGVRMVAATDGWNKCHAWDRRAKKQGQRHRVFCMSLGDFFESWEGPMVDHNDNVLWADACGNGSDRKHAFTSDSQPVVQEISNNRRLKMDDVRIDAFKVIEQTVHLDWLLLTKHGFWWEPNRVLSLWPRQDGSLQRFDNVWLLASVANQATADKIVPRLAEFRAAGVCRYVGISAEPLVGEIRLRPDWSFLDWCIVGGESKQAGRCRPFHLEWARSLVESCTKLGISVYVKQLGSMPMSGADGEIVSYPTPKDKKGGLPKEWPEWLRVRQYPNGESDL